MSAVAKLALDRFLRGVLIRRASHTGSIIWLAQRQPLRIDPSVSIQRPSGHEKWTGNGGILVRLDRTRIEALQQLLAQDPPNTLARYGLAMEYVRAGELARALAEFEALLAFDPAYSAAYFHSGQTLAKLGRLEEARDTFRRGVAVTKDPHARSELQAALDVLGG